MDHSPPINISSKSHASFKDGGGANIHHEEQPILSDHDDRREVIVNIDGGDGVGSTESTRARIWRESSYEFWKEGEVGENDDNDGEGFQFPWRRREAVEEDDPPPKLIEQSPSKLIEQFLSKQREAGVDTVLDVDVDLDLEMDMDELNRNSNSRSSHPLPESPPIEINPNRVSNSKEIKVSFHKIDTESGVLEKRCKESSDEDEQRNGEVLRCSSFQRRPTILRTKTRSRLIDPPEEHPDPRSPGRLRSGMVGRVSGSVGKQNEEEEEDPLFDEDIPEEYKRANLSPVTLLQWVSLVFIAALLACSLSIRRLKGQTLWGLQLWKWDVLVLVLICGRLVSGWGIRIAVFFIERNFLLRKKVLYFVYGLRKAVQNCIWLGLVLIAWHCMFDDKVQRETKSKFLCYVNKVLLCLLVGTLLWLVKTLMVKVLASSFHVSTFFDRIQESLFNQYVIETLSGPPLVEIHDTEEEEERTIVEIRKLQSAGVNVPPDLRDTALLRNKSGRVVGSGGLRKIGRAETIRYSQSTPRKQEEGISIDLLHRLSPKNISAWNMKRLMKTVRHGFLTTLDEQILDSTQDDESNTQIRSEVEAKVAARKIYRNVARHGSKFIYLEDLMCFMEEDEALKTMSLLGGSCECKRISKSSLKNWVVNAFIERRALALTLNDTKTAVNKLHQMVNVLIGIIVVIASLVILGIATSKFLLFLSSQIVVVAFVFGNTCKTIFEAIIFVFVMHPFDVGDRCEIENVQMIVEEMNILTTVFLRHDNLKIVYPNSTLSTKPISNYYRSPDMGDSVEFCVPIATPAEKIATMKQRITSYVESKKDHWYSSPTIVLKNLEDLNKLKMKVMIRHKMNHQNMVERWSRRAHLIEEMVKIFKDLDIEYRLLPLDINIRSLPPVPGFPTNWNASNN